MGFLEQLIGLTTFFYALLALGFLIFVHELGHFLAAKRVGVRVETFAIGFQPTLFGFRMRFVAFTRGDTEYVIGMLPFGGYVKMAGEEPGDPRVGSSDEFSAKKPGERALVLVAGSVVNIVFGFLFFIVAYAIGVPTESTQVGAVEFESAAWDAGLRPGDRITAIDGDPVDSFMEIIISSALGSVDRARKYSVSRPEVPDFSVSIAPRLNKEQGMPTLGLSRAQKLKVSEVVPNSPAARAGLEVGDLIESMTFRHGEQSWTVFPDLCDSIKHRLLIDFRDRYGAGTIEMGVSNGEIRRSLTLMVEKAPADAKDVAPRRTGVAPRRRVIVGVQAGSPAAAVFERGAEITALNGTSIEMFDFWTVLERASGNARVTYATASGAGGELARDDLLHWLAAGTIRVDGELPAEDDSKVIDGPRESSVPMIVGFVANGSPAQIAGVLPGDRIRKVNGEEIKNFADYAAAVKRPGRAAPDEKPLSIEIDRGGDSVTVSLMPTQIDGFLGFAVSDDTYIKQAGILGACALGSRETVLMVKRVFLTLRSLFVRSVSAKNLSGPIGIVMATKTTVGMGLARALFFLGLISVNLGVFNLLPFPILDGGHLAFLLIEKIRGAPVNERVMHYVHLVALLLLLTLAVYVTFHDIVRWFF
ncbi:MAG: RIP metalloprotease RseP [Planctomycetota bacterium]